MTNDEINQTLARIFPGDPVPDVSEATHWSDEPVSWRVSAPATKPTKLRRVESPRVKVAPETQAQFARVMDRLPPVVPSVPVRDYLLEAPENAARWLDEAQDIESDVKLGQPADPSRVTRLMLEAIPAVKKLAT